MSGRTKKLCVQCGNINERKGRKYCSLRCAVYARISFPPENDCWIWTGDITDGGYGTFYFGVRGNWKAHRASWVVHGGHLDDQILVCHHCDNPPCVNPDHLFLGTHMDNAHDSIAKGRNSKPPIHCGDDAALRKYPDLVRRGSENGNARYSDEQALAVLNSSLGLQKTLELFGVSQSFYYRIRSGEHCRRLHNHGHDHEPD